MGTGALLSVIVVHHQAGVNDSWDPAKQCQNQTEKETGNATGHEHRHLWHAEMPHRFTDCVPLRIEHRRLGHHNHFCLHYFSIVVSEHATSVIPNRLRLTVDKVT